MIWKEVIICHFQSHVINSNQGINVFSSVVQYTATLLKGLVCIFIQYVVFYEQIWLTLGLSPVYKNLAEVINRPEALSAND